MVQFDVVGERELVFNEPTSDVDVLENKFADNRFTLHKVRRTLVGNDSLVQILLAPDLEWIDLLLNDIDGRGPLTLDNLVLGVVGTYKVLDHIQSQLVPLRDQLIQGFLILVHQRQRGILLISLVEVGCGHH